MIKRFFVFCAALLIFNNAEASFADSAATIVSSKDHYSFLFNVKSGQVEIKQVLTKNYVSNSYQVNLQVGETYNNKVSIDEVTCKVDGRVPKGFKPLDEYYSINDIFYSDARVCYFNALLPKIGSLAEVSFRQTITDPRYFTSVFFFDQYRMLAKDVVFTIPRWMKVELKEMNFGTLDIKKTSTYDAKLDCDVVTFTAKNLSATKTEENSPGPTYIYPHIMVMCKSASTGGKSFTYFNTLNDQYTFYSSLVNSNSYDQSVISNKAKELAAGAKNDMDKIKAVFYYVQDNIRYIAFEDGVAGLKPENADEVLRKKYGDCKGMANLTKALLVTLGFDARLCWLGTKHIVYDYSTPSLAVDNHMICALYYNGKKIYLDATETYIGLNEYAERIQGRQVMIEDGLKYSLDSIPVAATTQNTHEELLILNVDGNNLIGTVKHIWKGEEKRDMLNGINSIKKEKADEALLNYLSDRNSNYSIGNIKVSGTGNADKDFTVSYQLIHKNAISSFGGEYYIDLDLKKEYMNSAIKIAERKHPYWFSHKTTLFKDVELIIPPGYSISSIPKNLDIKNSDYEFLVHFIVQPNKLIYRKKLIIKNIKLETIKFEQWNKDIESLSNIYNHSIVLKPTTK